MTETGRKHSVQSIFVVILFCLFAASLMLILVSGAGVYERVVSDMGTNYDSRTATSYIFNKIHSADTGNSISLDKFGDGDALLLMEEIDNIKYCTYIYCYDGKLMELFSRYDQTIEPAYGTSIMDINSMEILKKSGTLYSFNIITAENRSDSLYVHIHASGGES